MRNLLKDSGYKNKINFFQLYNSFLRNVRMKEVLRTIPSKIILGHFYKNDIDFEAMNNKEKSHKVKE